MYTTVQATVKVHLILMTVEWAIGLYQSSIFHCLLGTALSRGRGEKQFASYRNN